MADAQKQEFDIPYRVVSITEKTHKTSYPAISPSRPALSQAGRTVLITGGSGGIGYGIALAFATAGADRVIIVGRDEAKQQAAAASLAAEAGPASHTKFEGKAASPGSPENIDSLWDALASEGVLVDVLVLNAAFIVHVRSVNHYSERFWKQNVDKKRYLVNVATSAIHEWEAGVNTKAYALTKNSGVLLLQQVARDTPISKMQIVSFHPGAILSPGAKSAGATERTLDWDDISLPSSVAIWAASDEAAFLHGRFIWSAWDVEELRSGPLRERIEQDENYLRIGVHGV
ncbi:short chain dehydrogenase domain-containing protein [Trichoderma breve]|uniref:Short chain dehydrogenase domain-containing protein n=1 Tax=Trichoderma breve TaxID=2034170 RepID=A0A9W9E5F4_9HYPO|nr:short chain dehydrogenase domain-containing protein [Trichoderma breve]KAJ4857272.1 short chain dehydrogenase domain-containing protein [Trichoderma breve]